MKSQIHDEIDFAENELINLPAKLLEHSQTRPNDVAMRHKKVWNLERIYMGRVFKQSHISFFRVL